MQAVSDYTLRIRINKTGRGNIDFLSVLKIVKQLFKGLTGTSYSSRDQQGENNKTKLREKCPP